VKDINSYDHDAPVPKAGTTWVWEPREPHARAIVEVTQAKWNGEEWWVETKTLLPNLTFPSDTNLNWNDLGRFWEACRPVLMKLTGRMDQFTQRPVSFTESQP
jgi:hypothetical protein